MVWSVIQITEVWYKLLIQQEEKMSPSHTVKDNQNSRRDATHIYMYPLRVLIDYTKIQ